MSFSWHYMVHGALTPRFGNPYKKSCKIFPIGAFNWYHDRCPTSPVICISLHVLQVLKRSVPKILTKRILVGQTGGGFREMLSRVDRKGSRQTLWATPRVAIRNQRRFGFQSGAGVVLFMEVNNHVPLIFWQVAFTWMTLLTTMGDTLRSTATH